MSHAGQHDSAWQGSLTDLAKLVRQVQHVRAFGRLSLRNLERVSVVHLYFRAGKLVHVVGHRGDAHAILQDLQSWRRASLRFDRGVATSDVSLNDADEQLLTRTLEHLIRCGVVAAVPSLEHEMRRQPQVIEGDLVVALDARQLITPLEWRLLLESTRRVSFAVAHLVGPQEALKVLQDVLDDCASTFPAFACLKISPNGYLQVTDRSHLDRLSRDEVLEGFAALISICQHFCAPIIGESDAHKLMIQALQEMAPALTSIGVFRVDNHLLASGKF